MRDIFSLEPTTQILTDDPYIIAYPHLLQYFSSKKSLDAGDVVCGAHMVYGWMPTILEMHPGKENAQLNKAVNTLLKARMGSLINNQEIEELASLVNNSLVGASKLLHFVAPTQFPIWDSKVYSFVHEERPHHYRVNNVKTYKNYIQLLKSLTNDPRFQPFYASVQKKLDYSVSPMRALEIIMFLNAPVLQ